MLARHSEAERNTMKHASGYLLLLTLIISMTGTTLRVSAEQPPQRASFRSALEVPLERMAADSC